MPQYVSVRWGSASAKVLPVTAMRSTEAGMRSMSSGVRSTDSGSSAGSPRGTEPSGSSRAARWPCMRCALTTDVAACTAWSSASSTAPPAAGAVVAGTGSDAVTAPSPSAEPSTRSPSTPSAENTLP